MDTVSEARLSECMFIHICMLSEIVHIARGADCTFADGKKSIREKRNTNGEAIKLQHRTEHKSYSISAFSPLPAPHRLVLIGYLRDLTVKRLAVRRENRRDEEQSSLL